MWRTGENFHSRPYKKEASYWTDYHESHLLNITTVPVSVHIGRILQKVLVNFNLRLSEGHVSQCTYFQGIRDYLTASSGDFSIEFHPNLSRHIIAEINLFPMQNTTATESIFVKLRLARHSVKGTIPNSIKIRQTDGLGPHTRRPWFN